MTTFDAIVIALAIAVFAIIFYLIVFAPDQEQMSDMHSNLRDMERSFVRRIESLEVEHNTLMTQVKLDREATKQHLIDLAEAGVKTVEIIDSLADGLGFERVAPEVVAEHYVKKANGATKVDGR